MLDLQAKISSFRKMVWDEEKEKSESELYNSTEENSKLIENKKSELEENLKESLRERKIFAETRKNENVSKKEYEAKNNLYLYKQSLLEDLIKKIKANLITYTNSKEYRAKLNQDIKQSLKDLNLSCLLYTSPSPRD